MSLSYLYGKLNSSGTSSTDYTGGTTSTATVTVDNTSRLIYVDAKINVKEIEAEIAAARVEIADAKVKYDEIISKYSAFKEDIKTLKENDVKLEGEIQSAVSAIAEVDSRLSTEITTAKAELKEDIDKVKVEVEEKIQPKLDVLTVGLEAANIRIDEAEANIEKVKADVTQIIKEEIAKLKADIELLKIDVQKIIDTELTKIKDDIANLTKAISDETARAKAVEESKQATLISGVNIKTLNNLSLLGSGNIDITSAVWGKITGDINAQKDLIEAIAKGGSKEYTDQKFAEAKTHTDGKGDHLFYDKLGTIGTKDPEVWYLMSWIDGVETIIAGPYTMGGGGGGGSITEMHSRFVSLPETVSRSATSCEVIFYWDSLKGTEKIPTGKGTIYIYVGDELSATLGNRPLGDNTIDILPYIKDHMQSSVLITFKVVDAYNNYLQEVGTISFVDISLTCTFNTDKVWTTEEPPLIDCYPVGYKISKTLHYLVDGVEVVTREDITTSGEKISLTITIGPDKQPLKHGAHTLEVYFTCILGGKSVASNAFTFNFMYLIEGDKTPMITSSFDETIHRVLYIAFTIPYKVVSPGKAESVVTLLVNDKVVSILPKVSSAILYWEYKPEEMGNYKFLISCENPSGDPIVKTFNVAVTESEIDVKAVTENLTLYLSATGRSNRESEESRKKWDYTYITPTGEKKTISADLYNFNFSSDGWKTDENGNTVLRVAGDARVIIPVQPFAKECKDTGKTIEFEFATRQVTNYDTELVNCMDPNVAASPGFRINAKSALLKSMATEGVSSSYKEEEHIRVTFTIDKDVETDNRLILMYINGIMCSAIQYTTDDSFLQANPVNIYIGSSEATTDIYCIRLYDSNLTAKQVVNNWIADTQLYEEKKERYLRNNIFSSETGEIEPELLPNTLPYMIWDIDPLPLKKGDKRAGNVRYVNKLDSTKNFTAENAQYNVQGTSSAVYPVKNIRIKYKLGKDEDGTLWPTFKWYDDEGNTIKKYAINGGIPDNYFTHKVDYASSEGVNNVELVRLYNDVSKDLGYLNPPLQLNPEIRVGVDGFPIASFHKDSAGNISFNSKANFNNDKANEAVYGFQEGDLSWEITNNNFLEAQFKKAVTQETWANAFESRYPDPVLQFGKLDAKKCPVNLYSETSESSLIIATIPSPIELTITDTIEIPKPQSTEKIIWYKVSYEGLECYTLAINFDSESITSDLSKLQPMTEWVVSTDPEQATYETLPEPKLYAYTTVVRGESGSFVTRTIVTPVYETDSPEYRLSKFKAELANWFDVNSTLFYYIYTLMFLLVDSRAKNAFPTYFASRLEGDGGNRWFWLPYDMDTAIGINNEGKLVFGFELEDTDYTEEGKIIFNGQESVIWNNIRRMYSGEIALMYSKLRSTGTGRTVEFSFKSVEDRFHEHQSKWPENLFNKDSLVKYIEIIPTIGPAYLEMLQGDKAQQRKFWLYNRFKYMDSKFLAGEAKEEAVKFRAYALSDIYVTPFADTYVTVCYANSEAGYVTIRGKKDQTYCMKNPFEVLPAGDQETYIYSASLLKSVGDLSGFLPDTVDTSDAVHLQELKVGDGAEGYINANLTSLSVSANTLLKYLDVRNCTSLKSSIDASNCTEIETIWCEGSAVTGVALPDAGVLKSLHLPASISRLIIKNHPLLTDLVIENIGALSLQQLWIGNMKNCKYDVMSLVKGMPKGGAVRLTDIYLTYNTIDQVKLFYAKLDELVGIDDQGKVQPTWKALIFGEIHINSTLKYAEWLALSEEYEGITITASSILCTVTFYKTEKGVTPPAKYEWGDVEMGKAPVAPTVNPTKESSPEYNYTFVSWDTPMEPVYKDTDIYPIYLASDRKYKVTFDTRTSKVQVQPQYVKYKLKATKVIPQGMEEEFIDWYTDLGTVYDFTTPVTKEFTLYAKWKDDIGPTVSIVKKTYNIFQYTLKDNIAITAYAITTTPTTPTKDEWEYIIPTEEYVDEYTIDQNATYYVWAKDEKEHIASASIIAYSILKSESGGTVITIKDSVGDVGEYCLQDVLLTISYIADSHYDNVKFFFNEEEVTVVPFTILTDKDCVFRTESTPKNYVVKFDIGQYGKKPEDLIIPYEGLVKAPENQFVEQHIITAWHTSPGFEQGTEWIFTTSLVKGHMTLYAKWDLYSGSSIVDVTIPETNKIITCYYDQRIANSVTVDWGDLTSPSKSTKVGVVKLDHKYAAAGNYSVRITCVNGLHFLGGGTEDKPVIVPATNIKSIEFALNLAYTSSYALCGASNLTSVSISKYMTDIAMGMFKNCTSLTRLSLPNTLNSIGSSAFYNCSGLSGILTMPENLTSIGGSAFERCTGIIGITLTDSIKGIGDAAFKSCTSLADINIPDYITTLSSELFRDCTALTYIEIPETVTTLGTHVFDGCTNLSSISIMNDQLTAGEYCFDNCLNIKTGGPAGDGNTYDFTYTWTKKIPSKILEASQGGSALEQFVLADTIEEIGDGAFANTTLATINFPSSLLRIGERAFFLCYFLLCGNGQIVLPSKLQEIGAKAFYYCSHLVTMTVPASVTCIGNNAFELCIGLTTAYLHNTASTNIIKTQTLSWVYACNPKNFTVIHIPQAIKYKVELQYGPYWNFCKGSSYIPWEADLDPLPEE